MVTYWNRRGTSEFILPLIGELTKNEHPRVRGSIGFSMVKFFSDINFKTDAKNIILKTLKDKNASTRVAVAEAISVYFLSVPIELALEILQLVLADKNRYVRRYGVETISLNFAKLPYNFTVQAITNALNDQSAEVRADAVGAVRTNKNNLSKELFIKALKCNKQLCLYSGYYIDTGLLVFREH